MINTKAKLLQLSREINSQETTTFNEIELSSILRMLSTCNYEELNQIEMFIYDLLDKE